MDKATRYGASFFFICRSKVFILKRSINLECWWQPVSKRRPALHMDGVVGVKEKEGWGLALALAIQISDGVKGKQSGMPDFDLLHSIWTRDLGAVFLVVLIFFRYFFCHVCTTDIRSMFSSFSSVFSFFLFFKIDLFVILIQLMLDFALCLSHSSCQNKTYKFDSTGVLLSFDQTSCNLT